MADGKFICAKGITTLKVILASVQHGFWIFDIGGDINRLLGFYLLKADVFLMSKPASLNWMDKLWNVQHFHATTFNVLGLLDTCVVLAGSEILLQGKALDTSSVHTTDLVISTEKFTVKYKLIVRKAVADVSKANVHISVQINKTSSVSWSLRSCYNKWGYLFLSRW